MAIDFAVGEPTFGGDNGPRRNLRSLAMGECANGVGSAMLPWEVVGSGGIFLLGGNVEERGEKIARFSRRGGDELGDQQHLDLRLFFVEERVCEDAVCRA